jgi:hypothetical protein
MGFFSLVDLCQLISLLIAAFYYRASKTCCGALNYRQEDAEFIPM